MLKKRYIKSRKVCKVTFELHKTEVPDGVVVETVHLVGDLNEWDATATPMPLRRGGIYRAQVDLEPGREYQFRYLLNGQHWCSDRNADAYVPNQFGTDNCVVVTLTEA